MLHVLFLVYKIIVQKANVNMAVENKRLILFWLVRYILVGSHSQQYLSISCVMEVSVTIQSELPGVIPYSSVFPSDISSWCQHLYFLLVTKFSCSYRYQTSQSVTVVWIECESANFYSVMFCMPCTNTGLTLVVTYVVRTMYTGAWNYM